MKYNVSPGALRRCQEINSSVVGRSNLSASSEGPRPAVEPRHLAGSRRLLPILKPRPRHRGPSAQDFLPEMTWSSRPRSYSQTLPSPSLPPTRWLTALEAHAKDWARVHPTLPLTVGGTLRAAPRHDREASGQSSDCRRQVSALPSCIQGRGAPACRTICLCPLAPRQLTPLPGNHPQNAVSARKFLHTLPPTTAPYRRSMSAQVLAYVSIKRVPTLRASKLFALPELPTRQERLRKASVAIPHYGLRPSESSARSDTRGCAPKHMWR